MLITLILLACAQQSEIERRAEKAALVCYDNGILVYASETTIEELGVRLKQAEVCKEEEKKQLIEYQAKADSLCPLRSVSTEGRSKSEQRARRVAVILAQEECMKLAGNENPSSGTSKCEHRPAPWVSGKHARFKDKGTVFSTETLACVARVPASPIDSM
jgi:hypothetical protein